MLFVFTGVNSSKWFWSDSDSSADPDLGPVELPLLVATVMSQLQHQSLIISPAHLKAPAINLKQGKGQTGVQERVRGGISTERRGLL